MSEVFNWDTCSTLLWTNEAMESLGSMSKINEFISKVAMTGWSIWKAGNEFIFQQTPVVVNNIAARMEQAWEEFRTLIDSPYVTPQNTQVHNSSSHIKWKAPDKGQINFNCDASWKEEFGGGFGAVILRNHRGELLNGKKLKVTGSSVLVCEALTLREACLMAKALDLRAAQIESDNKCLISLCVSELVPPWECGCVILDIRQLVLDLNLSLLWIARDSNRAAHWVALLFQDHFLRIGFLTSHLSLV